MYYIPKKEYYNHRWEAIILNHNEDWLSISKRPDLPLRMIEGYQDKVNWGMISQYNSLLTEDFIIKYQNKIIWSRLSSNGNIKLSLDFIYFNKNKISFNLASSKKSLYGSDYKFSPKSIYPISLIKKYEFLIACS